ncbi:MAG TPA: UDP-N-acetylglucosamine--LPS N-acetylglucosamine transferase [Candidatus Omnitrophica bacterium]|nr:UDP-N-acetylglucosamine--LPS N-acetylglucosamine transferase [Candidatus Omnitrophota bacterium]
MKLCLVCSSGGHFLQLYALKEFWQDHDRFWVTFLGRDVLPLLPQEKSYDAYHPTNRNIVNLVRNLFLAFRVLKKEKPDCIISTGAGVGVPFIYAGKILGIKTVYIETLTRVNTLSLTGRLVYYVVDHFIAQWPELAKKYKKAVFGGRVL